MPVLDNLDPQTELLLLEAAERYCEMEQHIKPFLKNLVWPIHEKEPFSDSFHIDAYCDHIEAMANGDLQYLVVNVPFRTTKSTVFSVALPSWWWIRKPSTQFLTGSYAASLAIRDTLRARRVIMHPSYQAAWGDRFYMGVQQQRDSDSPYSMRFRNLMSQYENSETGSRLSFGFDQGTTGQNSDFLLIDDPYPQDPTPGKVQKVTGTFDQVLFNRQNNANTWCLCIIMYRYGEDDLTAHVKDLLGSSSKFAHLVIPMEYDPKLVVPGWRGWTDPRTEEGQVIDPSRFTPEYIAQQKVALNEYGYMTKCQQQTLQRGGGEIKTKDIVIFSELPNAKAEGAEDSPWDVVEEIQHWDTAGTDKTTSAYWCGMHWKRTRNQHYFLCDMIWKQMKYDNGRNAVGEFYRKHKPKKAYIENKSTGIAILGEKDSHEKLVGCNILPWDVHKDKVTRMRSKLGIIEAGRVHVYKHLPYHHEFMRAIMAFPNGTFADIIDTLSQSLAYFDKPTMRARIS